MLRHFGIAITCVGLFLFGTVLIGGVCLWAYQIANGGNTESIFRAVSVLSSSSLGLILIGFMIRLAGE